MSIVAMKRLGLIALQADREKLMDELQRLGCVEVSVPTAPEDDPCWDALSHPPESSLWAVRERAAMGDQALALLKQYAGVKGRGFNPRPVVDEATFFDQTAYDRAGEMVSALVSAQKELSFLNSEKSKLLSQRSALTPWLELDVPLETASTESVTALFGSLPSGTDLQALSEALGVAGQLCHVILAGKDTNFQYLFFLCHSSVWEEVSPILQNFGFSRTSFRGLVGTAKENDEALRLALEENEKKTTEQVEKVKSFAPHVEDIRLYADQTACDLRREEAKSRLMDTEGTFYLTGWFPASQEEKLTALLKNYTCAWESETPAEEDYPQVPVKLKNNWFTAPLSMVTEMYSLPAYGSIDPNPLMAPFFILFYGMMMADMGYGLIMMAVSAFGMIRLKPKGATMRYMTPLIGLCGVSTFLWGAVTGGFFGDLIPQMAKLINPNSTFALPTLFSPLDDAVAVLVGALVLGVTQIFVGMGASAVQKCKRGQVADMIFTEVTWWAILIGGGLTVAAMMLPDLGIPALPGLCILIGGGVLLVAGSAYNAVQSTHKPVMVVLMTLKNIGGALYNNVTGYFSDILSYSRLMALMLAGAVVAQVFNQLGVMTGNVVTFFLIAMIGNALNFALNILGCYVHDMRLQCLEFFGRFYEDGGKPFQPMDITTKYVDVTNH